MSTQPRPQRSIAVRVNASTLCLIGALITTLMGFTTSAFAADAKTDKKKTSKIDFEDELVEGELKKPELFYLLQKKQFNFKRLIKLREDFLPEMRRDGDEVRRSRSK